MLIRFVALLITGYLTVSCGVHTKFIGSKPSLGEREVRTHRINLSGLDLNIRPYNDIRDFQMVNSIVLIPVYISGEDEAVYADHTEFNFLFGYLPHEEGYFLDPTQITLVIDGVSLNPTVLSQWRNQARKYGDSWYGYCGRPIPDSYHRISSEPAGRDELNNWHCYQLRYDIPPPHPSKKFSLIIDGFTKEGEKYEVPTIWFEEYSWQSNDSVP